MLTKVYRQAVDSADTKQRQILSGIDQSILQQLLAFPNADEQFRHMLLSVTTVQHEIGAEGEATRKFIADLNSEAHDEKLYDMVMKSLAFRTMHQRREETRTAFCGTYEWIFKQNHKMSHRWSNFVEWLQQGDDIYWINGKAGSGKSTLMNFIWNHESYMMNLKLWAGTYELVTPSFFFHYGSEEQSSISGLIRALLFQILEACPNLMKFVSPFMPHQVAVPWSRKVLTEALMSVINQQHQAIRLCILIDGLDEFQGDVDEQESLTNLVREVSSRDSAKLCVSSRPEAHLIYNFNNFSKMRLQDLTFADMELYTQQEFKKYPLMTRYAHKQPSQYRQILQDLPRKADGIFLWLYLAIQDLKAGIMKLDSLETLQKRLTRMDSSLDGLFSQLLSAVDPEHLSELALHLQLVLYNHFDNFIDLAFGAHEELRRNLRKIWVWPSSDVSESTINELSQQLQDLEMRIQAQSAGLLDIYKEQCFTDNMSKCKCVIYSENLSTFSSITQLIRHFSEARIKPIHRSVKEFVERSPEAQNLIKGELVTDAQLKVIDLRGVLASAASQSRILLDYHLDGSCLSNFNWSHARNLDRSISHSLSYFFLILADLKRSSQLNSKHIKLADELNMLLTGTISALVEAANGPRFPPLELDGIFREDDMDSNYMFICNAMRYGLETPSEFFKGYDKDDRGSLMAWCFLSALESGFETLFESLEVIIQLLDLGIDPNFQPGQSYPCRWIQKCDLSNDDSDPLSYFEIFLTRIVGLKDEYGDLTADVNYRENLLHLAEAIERAMHKFLDMKADPYLSVKHKFDFVGGTTLRLSIKFSSSVVFIASRVLTGWYPHNFSAVVKRMLACGAKVSSKALTLSLAGPPQAPAPKLCTTHVEAKKSREVVTAWQRWFWVRSRQREQGSSPPDEELSCEAVENTWDVALRESLDAIPISYSDTEDRNEMIKDIVEAMGPEYLELYRKARRQSEILRPRNIRMLR